MTGSDYPVILALEDFVPTGLALVGFWILGGLSGRVVPRVGQIARVSAVLIGVGGLAKSTWKLLLAGFSIDWPWLEAALFPLMALGAAGLLWGLSSALRRRSVPWWPFAAALATAVVVATGYGTIEPVFAFATTGVTAISVLAAVIAGRRRAWGAVALYVAGLAFVLLLVPLRDHPDHETLAMQWVEQGTNTLAQAALLVAAWLTARAHTLASASPHPTPTQEGAVRS
ncbi:hypothetical protein GCM10027280_05890 [Micromonospora polyrhachis]|uniref:MFS family permease n=1 Tax=Micromonospora polyrhachis TaxID=1282883 RepID=A0A7W7SLQ4_9ACTN|nr:hypothetical protein [Micromonospora polyrhachis]MBB4956502.1 MFS family permease [Micromonospora polyrhachis]